MADANQWLNNKTVKEQTHPKTGATALHVASAKGYVKVMKYYITTISINFQYLNPRKQCLWRVYSKTCLKRSFKKETKIAFQDRLSLNAGQKYCRMLQGEHSAKLSTFIKLPFVIKIFVWSIFEWPLNRGFTVMFSCCPCVRQPIHL